MPMPGCSIQAHRQTSNQSPLPLWQLWSNFRCWLHGQQLLQRIGEFSKPLSDSQLEITPQKRSQHTSSNWNWYLRQLSKVMLMEIPKAVRNWRDNFVGNAVAHFLRATKRFLVSWWWPVEVWKGVKAKNGSRMLNFTVGISGRGWVAWKVWKEQKGMTVCLRNSGWM